MQFSMYRQGQGMAGAEAKACGKAASYRKDTEGWLSQGEMSQVVRRASAEAWRGGPAKVPLSSASAGPTLHLLMFS